MERRRGVDYLLYTAEIGFLFWLLHNAFSWRTKQQILQRDGGKCVKCGSTEGLEAAHINHSRNYQYYDDPRNGRILCTKDHYFDHKERAGRNGLTKSQNDWALAQLWKRLMGQLFPEEQYGEYV